MMWKYASHPLHSTGAGSFAIGSFKVIGVALHQFACAIDSGQPVAAIPVLPFAVFGFGHGVLYGIERMQRFRSFRAGLLRLTSFGVFEGLRDQEQRCGCSPG